MKYLFIIFLFILGCTKEEEAPVSAAPINDICNEIDVQPNPAQDIIIILFKGPLYEVSLKILDVNGSMLYENYYSSIEDGVERFDLTNQPKGVYIVRVEADKGECIIKLVKN